MLGGCKTGASAGNGQPQPLSENSGALHMEGCDWKPDATLAGRGGEGGAVATWEWASGGASGKSTSTDLYLYQLDRDPGLPALAISATTPANTTAVTMIGGGSIGSS